jgi:hypothetical protein
MDENELLRLARAHGAVWPDEAECEMTRAELLAFARAVQAAERERCAHACREWQAGRLPQGIGTHDLLRAIKGPNREVLCER